MRKFYSLVLSALVAIPMAMNAQMTEENEVLANLEDGYRLEKDVNFKAATVNGVAIQPAYSLQFGAEVSGVKINGYVPKFLTNTGLEFMSFSLPGDNIDWPNNNALRSTKNERWIIYDEKRKIYALYDLKNISFFNEKDVVSLNLTLENNEIFYENLWKTFFETISIKQRKNKKVQMNFMPRKYWKNMIEMEDEL